MYLCLYHHSNNNIIFLNAIPQKNSNLKNEEISSSISPQVSNKYLIKYKFDKSKSLLKETLNVSWSLLTGNLTINNNY